MTPDEAFLTDLAELLGTPMLDDAEQEAVLDLTRVVAHGGERRFGPLTIYALALTLSDDIPSAERAARLRETTAMIEQHLAR